MKRLLATIVIAVTVVACGEGTEGIAVVGSSPQSIGTGEQRLVLAIADDQGALQTGGPRDITATFSIDGEVFDTVETEWVWAIEGARGFSVAYTSFDRPGTWEVVLDPADGPPTPPTPFAVQAEIALPEVGEPAIASITPTHPDQPFEEITTDPTPEPEFYRLSVDEAISNGRPTVIIFATPAYCQTAVCGPTMEVAKTVAAAHPGADFVHVEVFTNLTSGGAGALEPHPAIAEWALPTEPWVYVVDEDGIIVARFEGAVDPSEIDRALVTVDG